MKHVFSGLLALVMCLSLLIPAAASGEPEETVPPELAAAETEESADVPEPEGDSGEAPEEEPGRMTEPVSEADKAEQTSAAGGEEPVPNEEPAPAEDGGLARGSCGDGLTWTLDQEGTLTITGEGEMTEAELPANSIWYESYRTRIKRIVIGEGVTAIGSYAFADCAVEEVSLPSSLRHVGGGAFSGCSSLTEIELPEGVTHVGDNAFSGCRKLVKAVLPDSVGFLEQGAFRNCAALEEVRLPAGLTSLESYMFYGCGSLSAVELPETLKRIGEYVFYECVSLTAVSIPAGVRSVGSYAFFRCKALAHIALPDGVTWITDCLFTDCTSLETVKLPKSVTKMGTRVFAQCSSLRSVTLPDGIQSVATYNFYKCTSLEEIVIPEGVTGIGETVFTGCSALKTVSLPASLNKIGTDAFSGCSALTCVNYTGGEDAWAAIKTESGNELLTLAHSGSVSASETVNGKTVTWTLTDDGVLTISGETISKQLMDSVVVRVRKLVFEEGVTYISCSFSACGNLEEISLPGSLMRLGQSVFRNCAELRSVTLPEGMTEIGEYAFSGCTGLTEITIPVSMTRIGLLAFDGCTALTTVHYAGTDEQLSEIVSASNDWLLMVSGISASDTCGEGLTWRLSADGVLTITGTGTMTDYRSGYSSPPPWYTWQSLIRAVVIGDGVESIGSYAFNKAYNLEELTLGSGVKSIGAGSFSECTGLRSITLPDGLERIGDSAFFGCTGLTAIALPESVTTLDSSVFQGCTALETAELPTGLTSLSVSLFGGCESLRSIALPEGLTDLGGYAFYGCASLQSVDLPAGLTSIGDAAFSGCAAITDAAVPDGVTTLADYTFKDCRSLERVTLPAGLTSIGSGAFGNCAALQSIELPAGITSIGTSAFSGCASLASAVVPAGVTKLGIFLFSGCTALRTVVLPAGVKTIGSSMFKNCTSLTEITVPAGVTVIAENAFANCASLSAITLPASLTRVGQDAFVGCGTLTEVDYEGTPEQFEALRLWTGNDRLTLAYYGAVSGACGDALTWSFDKYGVLTVSGTGPMYDFDYHEAPWESVRELIDDIVIGDGAESIGAHAFCECTNAASVSLPDGLQSIGTYAFDGCSSLTELRLPSGLTEIGKGAFRQCGALAEVNFPDSLKTVGDEAFLNCAGIRELCFPDGLESIGSSAFAYTSIMELTLPESLVYVGSGAFACELLFEADVPEGVEIGGAFAGSRIASLTIGGRSVSLLNMAVEYGPRVLTGTPLMSSILTGWYMEESAATINTEYMVASLAARAVAQGMVERGEITDIRSAYDWLCRNCSYSKTSQEHTWATGAFFNGMASCNGTAWAMKAFLDELGYPNVVQIGSVSGTYASGPHAWNEVYIDGSWYVIDAALDKRGNVYLISPNRAASGFTITGSSIKYNGTNYAKRTECLENFVSLETVSEQPLTLTQQDDGSWWVTDCEPGARSVEIPAVWQGAPVTGIGPAAFEDCWRLASVTIPEGIETIGAEAFSCCIALRSVTLPSTVRTLSGGAFSNCVQLESLDLSATKIKGRIGFWGCLSLMEVKLPAGVQALPTFSARGRLINNTSGMFSVTIYGYSGTAVEQEANQKGYPFVSLGEHIHTWDEGRISKQPACGNAGDMTYTCTVCGAEYTEEGAIPPSHRLTHIGAKAPTYEAEGNIEYWECSECGRCFADADGTEEIARASVVIGRLVRPAGDVNTDDAVDALDAAAVLRYLVGLDTGAVMEGADPDGDGVLTPADAAAILRSQQ